MLVDNKSDLERDRPVHVKMYKDRREQLPRELQYHELEESREYRQSRQGNYPEPVPRDRPYQVKSSRRPPSNVPVNPPSNSKYDDPIEKYRPIEYRKKSNPYRKPDPNDTPSEEEDYDQFRSKRKQPRPVEVFPKEDPRLYPEEEDPFRPMKK